MKNGIYCHAKNIEFNEKYSLYWKGSLKTFTYIEKRIDGKNKLKVQVLRIYLFKK